MQFKAIIDIDADLTKTQKLLSVFKESTSWLIYLLIDNY